MKQLVLVAVVVLLGIIAFFYFTVKSPAEMPSGSVSTSTTATTTTSIPSVTDASYQNDQFGFSFNYPNNAFPTTTFATSYLAAADWSLTASFDGTTGSPAVAVVLPYSDEMKAGELRIGVSTSSTAIEKCLMPPQDSGSSATSAVAIQGQMFTTFDMADAAMNHQLEAKIYRAVHDGACYSIEAIVTGTNPEVYNPPRTVPFTTSMGFDALNSMIQSFSFSASLPVEVQ